MRPIRHRSTFDPLDGREATGYRLAHDSTRDFTDDPHEHLLVVVALCASGGGIRLSSIFTR